jgi:hypothetical protein
MESKMYIIYHRNNVPRVTFITDFLVPKQEHLEIKRNEKSKFGVNCKIKKNID